MGGSSKKVTAGYKYYLGFHMVICQSPIDKLIRILVDDRVAWTGSATDEEITIDKPNLFGGEDREGGVTGSVDIATGLSTQAPNTYLSSKIGADIPAYRGVVSAILKGVYVGLNPYLKPWAFKAQRINLTSNGSEQWYPSKAPIRSYKGYLGYEDAFLWSPDKSPDNSIFPASDYGEYLDETQVSAPGEMNNGIHNPRGSIFVAKDRMPNSTKMYIEFTLDADLAAYPRIYNVGWGFITKPRWADFTYNGASTSPSQTKEMNEAFSFDSYSKLDSGVMGIGSTVGAQHPRWLELRNDVGSAFKQDIATVSQNINWGSTVMLAVDFTLEKVWWGFDGTWLNGNPSSGAGGTTLSINSVADQTGSAWYAFTQFGEGDNSVSSDTTIKTATIRGSSSAPFLYDVPEGFNIIDEDLVYTGEFDMNPAHIIRECLTDAVWGLGYSSIDIDEQSFIDSADTLYAEEMGISILWDKEIPIIDFVNIIINHIDGSLFIDKSTGKFKLKLIRETEVSSPTLYLGEDEIFSITNYAKKPFGELVNSVTVNYMDAGINEVRSVTVQDVALIQMQGSVISTTIQYPGFSNESVATRAAQRDLKSLSSQLRSCTISCSRVAASLEIADTFVLTWPDLEFNQVTMRVQSIEYGSATSNEIKIKAIEDVFSLPTNSIITSPDIYDPGIGGTAENAVPRLLIEAPYYELVQRLGQTAVDETLSSSPEAGYIIAAGGRPTGGINSRLYVDSGAGYEDSGNLEFSPFGYLAADVLPGETTIVVQNTQDVDLVETATHLQVNDELMVINSITENSSGYEVGVGRGILDTVPAPLHSTGDAVIFWDVYGETDEVEYVAIETIFSKILTITGTDQLLLADAAAESVTLDYRAIRPYPPGNVKVNGTAYPSYIGETAELQITWSHRDRLQQTSGELYDTTYGNIGPEAGVTYALRIYGEDDTLLRTETGITGTSYTYLEDDELSDSKLSSDSNTSYSGDSDTTYRLNYSLRFELEAVRVGVTSDDLTSFQFHNITVVRGSS